MGRPQGAGTAGGCSSDAGLVEVCRAAATPAVVFAFPAMKVTCCNDGFRLWGGDSAEHANLWPDWPGVSDALQSVARRGLPTEVELPEMGKAKGPVRLVCAPVWGTKGVDAAICWLTGAGLASQEVRKTAERALAAKSRFLAAASHDLRQPFQAMRLFHGLLAQQAEAPRMERTIDLLGNAITSGEQLLNSLLDVSRLDAGMVQPNLGVCDLKSLLASLVGEFRSRAEAKGLRLRAQMPSFSVNTDPVLLARILRNFLDNAVTYTRRGGILVGARRRGVNVRIEVWDTGFGIPAEKASEIFEEFSQLENPERDRSRGMGLGLAIVRRLAGLLSAPVDVRSRLGLGSRFDVTVPRAETASPESKPEPEAFASGKGLTLLVVEDDRLVLCGLQSIMESWGYSVLVAETMACALQHLDRAEPDLILSDLRLRGGLTGFDVIDRVRTIAGHDIPAILLTGDTGEQELIKAREQGLKLLHKPITPDNLKHAVNRMLGH